MTRAALKLIVQSNLRELGISNGRFQDTELNEAIQDAYNDVAARSRFLVKNDVLAFEDNQVYYDFTASGVTDYMGYIAIYNRNTNLWLKDNLSRRDLDRVRSDWEVWNGQPTFVVSHSFSKTILVPKMVAASGYFSLVYWALAPILTSDSDTFLVATDMLTLLEDHVCGSLLEGDEEITKAQPYLTAYEKRLEIYKTRCANVAKTDLSRRVY